MPRLTSYALFNNGEVIYLLKGRAGLTVAQVKEQARLNINAEPQSPRTLGLKLRLWDATVDRIGAVA